MSNSKPARPRIDPSTVVDFGDSANSRQGRPSSFIRNETGGIDIVPDEVDVDATEES